MVKIIVISFYYTYLFKWIRCWRRALNVSDDNSSGGGSSTTPKTIKSALSWICAPLLLFVCSSKWSSKMHVIPTYLFSSFASSLSLPFSLSLNVFSLHTFIHHLAYKLVCAVCWMCRAAPVPHSTSSNTIKSTHVCLSLNAFVALVNHFGHRERGIEKICWTTRRYKWTNILRQRRNVIYDIIVTYIFVCGIFIWKKFGSTRSQNECTTPRFREEEDDVDDKIGRKTFSISFRILLLWDTGRQAPRGKATTKI